MISGHILASNGNPIGGVYVYSYNPYQFVTTDIAGYYEFRVPENWTGQFNPKRSGYAFTPGYRSYKGVNQDLTGQDFTSRIAPHTPTPIAPEDEKMITTLTPSFE